MHGCVSSTFPSAVTGCCHVGKILRVRGLRASGMRQFARSSPALSLTPLPPAAALPLFGHRPMDRVFGKARWRGSKASRTGHQVARRAGKHRVQSFCAVASAPHRRHFTRTACIRLDTLEMTPIWQNPESNLKKITVPGTSHIGTFSSAACRIAWLIKIQFGGPAG